MDLTILILFVVYLCFKYNVDDPEETPDFDVIDRETKLNETSYIDDHAFERISNELLRYVRTSNSSPNNINT